MTRLADGSETLVAEPHIVPLLQQKVNTLFTQGLQLVVLLCTGHFPGLQARGILLQPRVLLSQAAVALGYGRRIGVLCPAADQSSQMSKKWGKVLGDTPVIQPVSPYHQAVAIVSAAEMLKNAGVELIVMDCIGYTIEMQSIVQEKTGVLALLPRSLAAQAIREGLY